MAYTCAVNNCSNGSYWLKNCLVNMDAFTQTNNVAVTLLSGKYSYLDRTETKVDGQIRHYRVLFYSMDSTTIFSDTVSAKWCITMVRLKISFSKCLGFSQDSVPITTSGFVRGDHWVGYWKLYLL